MSIKGKAYIGVYLKGDEEMKIWVILNKKGKPIFDEDGPRTEALRLLGFLTKKQAEDFAARELGESIQRMELIKPRGNKDG